MKSTGEVMGTAGSFGKAYEKAQKAVGKPIPLDGTAIVDLPVLGFEEHFDVHDLDDFEADELEAMLHNEEIDLVISRDRDVLEICVEESITYFSTIESAEAALEAINSADQPLAVQDIGERPKTQREWGR
jgi:carbamoyl-phosphate synthase large subunit